MIILLSKIISDYYKLLSMLEEILLSSNRPSVLHILGYLQLHINHYYLNKGERI